MTGTSDAVAGPVLLSRLLGAPVHGQSGELLGVAHDLRFRRGADQESALGPITGLVVGLTGWRPHLAHSWGFVQDGSTGPALLRALFTSEASRARVVPVDGVLTWNPPLTVRGPLDRHPRLAEQERS